ncbi:predicted protein [Coccidioides posadasii str. Silveira]|uniref:Predicted protein n=1 Tax=Coccidioides posadasii (strain RMSCC 757 / Silveira) TaxID=443226 RepID=E9DIP9_COCPS|nr:predicted protein [Coccidioides posadasii str. Silveira]
MAVPSLRLESRLALEYAGSSLVYDASSKALISTRLAPNGAKICQFILNGAWKRGCPRTWTPQAWCAAPSRGLVVGGRPQAILPPFFAGTLLAQKPVFVYRLLGIDGGPSAAVMYRVVSRESGCVLVPS